MEKTSNMDDPRDKDNGLQKKDEDSFVNFSDFFQPTWFRRFIRSSDEVDRFILDNRFNLLFHISPVFWILFFTGKILR